MKEILEVKMGFSPKAVIMASAALWEIVRAMEERPEYFLPKIIFSVFTS
ncbi:MAG: hypothetical protein BWY86_01364 [Candidatus Aminicenantes bacterium ADurb.Bin508]|nr:MAG: hypothetical protein BWY86_01364 [Candidatus Aminicenantes bacterium ADurb.Bin508]